MKITWIGQSGYIIKTETAEIIIDPYLSDIVNKISNRPRLIPALIKAQEIRADAVICTHAHMDHLDTETVKKIPEKQFFVTTEEGARIIQNSGHKNVFPLHIGETIRIKNIKIKAVYAKHTIEAFGILLQTETICLYFSGDTLYDEKLFSIAEYCPDISFLCINGKLGNMNVKEAARIAKKIGAKINVPNHYGMFASNTEDPRKFTSYLTNGFIMEYGKEYEIENILHQRIF